MGSCCAVVSLPKNCQRCGVEFACGLCGCWCDEIALDPATRASLKEQFTDCLCRNCLEQSRGPGTTDQGRTSDQERTKDQARSPRD